MRFASLTMFAPFGHVLVSHFERPIAQPIADFQRSIVNKEEPFSRVH